MIKDARLLAEFEENELRKEKPDYASALRIFEVMWKEAMLMGVLPLKDPIEEIDVDIKIARILTMLEQLISRIAAELRSAGFP